MANRRNWTRVIRSKDATRRCSRVPRPPPYAAGPDNLIVSWNSAAEQLLGYSALEAIGKPLSIIIPGRYRTAHDAGHARAVKVGQAHLAGRSVEMLALHADGHEVPVDLSFSMWSEAGKPMFGALLRDITDRHSAQTGSNTLPTSPRQLPFPTEMPSMSA